MLLARYCSFFSGFRRFSRLYHFRLFDPAPTFPRLRSAFCPLCVTLTLPALARDFVAVAFHRRFARGRRLVPRSDALATSAPTTPPITAPIGPATLPNHHASRRACGIFANWLADGFFQMIAVGSFGSSLVRHKGTPSFSSDMNYIRSRWASMSRRRFLLGHKKAVTEVTAFRKFEFRN